MIDENRPSFVVISRWADDIYREAFRKIGPRHRLVDRWTRDLGWTIAHEVVREFLADEARKAMR